MQIFKLDKLTKTGYNVTQFCYKGVWTKSDILGNGGRKYSVDVNILVWLCYILLFSELKMYNFRIYVTKFFLFLGNWKMIRRKEKRKANSNQKKRKTRYVHLIRLLFI